MEVDQEGELEVNSERNEQLWCEKRFYGDEYDALRPSLPSTYSVPARRVTTGFRPWAEEAWEVEGPRTEREWTRAVSLVSRSFSNLVKFQEDVVRMRRRLGDLSVSGAGPRSLSVRFLWGGGGRNVMLTGSFNGWTIPMQMRRRSRMRDDRDVPLAESTVWELILPLVPDTYQYRFIVDGEWRVDSERLVMDDERIGTVNEVRVELPKLPLQEPPIGCG